MIFFRAMVLERTMTLLDWLDVAAALPLEGTEIHHRTLAGRGLAEIEPVRAALRARGLRVSQLTAAPDFTHPDVAYREEQVARVTLEIDTASALGAACVRITAGQAHPGMTRADGVRRVVECVRRLLGHAARRGVRLAFENHYKDYFWDHPDFAQRTDVFLDIVGALRADGLRVNFDTSNQVMIGEDPLVVLREVADLVVHVHCSDRARPGEYEHAPAGEGAVDFPGIFKVLRGAGYDGWLSAEYNGPEGLDGLRRALEYIRRTWNSALTED